MENERMSLDDLHNQEEPVVTPTEETTEPKEGEPVEPVTDPTESVEESTEPVEPTEPASTVENAMEDFLANFSVEGGMIEFEDGTKTHFNELSEEEKLNVLTSLTDSKSTTSNSDLSEEEAQILEYARQQEKPLDQYLEELAQQRVEQLMSYQQTGKIDFDQVSDDAITEEFLKQTNPEATADEIKEELSRLKEGKFFEANAKKYREDFAAAQENAIQQAEVARQQEIEAQNEADRAAIVERVAPMEDLMGFKLTNEDKNSVLGKVLETNSQGDSLFMEEVFGSPENLFKAAWLYQNAEERFDQMDEYYKKEVTKAYARGKQAAIDGMPSQRTSGTSTGNPGNAEPEAPRQAERKVKSLDELHED